MTEKSDARPNGLVKNDPSSRPHRVPADETVADEVVVAETARLYLRRITVHEAPLLHRVFGDADVMRFSLGGPRDMAWCEQRAEAILKSYAEEGFGVWRVEKKESGQAIGYCGLKRWDDIDGRDEIEIGYRYVQSVWGKGYASEAALAVRDLGIETFGLKRMVSLIEPENIGSWRVAEKIGMRLEKTITMDGLTVRVYVIEA